jgi:hypothetical protein
MITKSFAGVAAGALLVGGATVAVAEVEPSSRALRPTATTTTSPLVAAQSDTSGYPGSVVTTTSVHLPRSVQYGAAHQARVAVDATGTRDVPRGSVTVTVAGSTQTAKLQEGVAVVPVARSLKPGHYTARARYAPASRSQFKSSSGSDTFTVVKTNSQTVVQAFNTSRGERPTVRVSVESPTHVTPKGNVTVTIADGKARESRSVRLVNGQAVVGFSKADRRGQWDARAVYGGSDSVNGSRGADTFRVTR